MIFHQQPRSSYTTAVIKIHKSQCVFTLLYKMATREFGYFNFPLFTPKPQLNTTLMWLYILQNQYYTWFDSLWDIYEILAKTFLNKGLYT